MILVGTLLVSLAWAAVVAASSSKQAGALMVGVPIAVLWGLSMRATELHRASGRLAWAYAPSLLLFPALLVAMTFTLLETGFFSDGICAIGGAGVALLVVVCAQEAAFWHGGSAPPRQSGGLRLEVVRGWLHEGALFLLGSVGTIVIASVDVILVGLIASLRDAAIYAAASRTARLAGVGLTAANAAVAGDISRMLASGDDRALRSCIRGAVVSGVAVAGVITVALIGLAHVVLRLYGASYGSGSLILVSLAIAQLINAATGPGTYLLNLAGQNRLVAQLAAIGAAITVASVATCAALFGATGAGFASAGATIAFNMLIAYFCRRRLGILPILGFV
jgi:O-antigen/teichoic acid export membrane protein